MKFPLFHAVLAPIATTILATPLKDRAVDLGLVTLFEKVAIPSKWTAAGTPSSSTMMGMQIALKQNNIAGLQAKLLDIASPKSQNYGKWLSREEMEAYTSPSNESVQAVTAWLGLYGISSDMIFYPTPDWMYVKVPLSQAEKLLSTTYMLYKDASGIRMPRASQYSIPLLLHEHINTIQPTTAFHLDSLSSHAFKHSASNLSPQVAKYSARNVSPAPANSTCSTTNVTISCIQSYYNVDYTGGPNQSTLAVTVFQGFEANHQDAAMFLQKFVPQATGTSFTFTDIAVANGSIGDTNNVEEGNLDTQMALGLGYPNAVKFLSVGPSPKYPSEDAFQDELVNFGTYLNSASDVPSIISTSYAFDEASYSNNYLDRICNEFMKAGSLGISLLFATGDSGVGGDSGNCSTGYNPAFPASCPYVTAVGATQFYSGGEEVAVFGSIDDGGGGGGFSNFFPTPSYQSSVVQSYIKGLNGQSSGLYNSTGRGYPDVSLVGQNVSIAYQGSFTAVSGTSISAPAWAALISQINDYRLSAGKSVLGFLNPALYAADSSSFLDITIGSNGGCGTNGFPATTGWDSATGLGTMNFANLRQALL